jgi:hypothetical protein
MKKIERKYYMKKKTTKTIVNEYDKDGKLLKTTETIVEEDIYDYYPSYPYQTSNKYKQTQ